MGVPLDMAALALRFVQAGPIGTVFFVVAGFSAELAGDRWQGVAPLRVEVAVPEIVQGGVEVIEQVREVAALHGLKDSVAYC